MCSHIIFPRVHYLLCQNTCTQDARPCHNLIHQFNGHSEDNPWILLPSWVHEPRRSLLFLWPNLDKLSQVLQTESWRTNVDGNSRTWSHLHCDLPPRRRSNCSSMLVLYLVLACCLDYFLIHLFCLTNNNLTLGVATNLSRRCYF